MWKKLGGKTAFCDKLKCECNMHSASDLAMYMGDFSGHIGRHIDGFRGVSWRAWCRSDEFGTKSVIRVVSGRKNMCVKYMV